MSQTSEDDSTIGAEFCRVVQGSVMCPNGAGDAGRIDQVAIAAASGSPWRCACGQQHSAWDALRHALAEPSDLWHAIALGGGGQSLTTLTIKREDKIVRLHLPDIGVPEDGQALRIVVTPVGHPVGLCEITQTIGHRDPLPQTVYLKPVPFAEDDDADWSEMSFALCVPWRPRTEDRSHELLLAALTSYGDRDWKRAALDGSSAVDLALREQSEPLLRTVGARSRDRFATRQCLILLELLARAHHLPTLTDPVKVQLGRLKDLRDGRAAHPGA